MSTKTSKGACTSASRPNESDDPLITSFSPISVEEDWLLIGGCKVGKLRPHGVLEVHDKCKRRSAKRGTDKPKAKLETIMRVVRDSQGDT